MEEKRKAPRLQEENEVTITVVSEGDNLPHETVMHNRSKDISVGGTRIQADLYLPVDTLLMLEMKLNTVRQMITVIGKVKWIKIIYQDEAYEAGVEFVNTPRDAMRKLQDYISWKIQYRKTQACSHTEDGP
ncbi:MAG TPA: PilZ domain-containing protein [Smithellaceae bacterium]|nr:PilZ domain-containing protein [Smithellaceae bacterium]